jgi:cell division protein FtsI/penicillin-binding protein 2
MAAIAQPSGPARMWRVWAVMTVMAMVALAVVVRLVLLQVSDHQTFSALAQVGQNQIVDLEPWRGLIFDRDGIALAVNEVEYEITAAPEMITSTYQVGDRLAPLLERPRAEIQATLEEAQAAEVKWLMLARRVPKPIGEAIQSLTLSGVQVRAVQRRRYPQGPLAAHNLGFVADNGLGYYGVEAYFQTELAGEHVQNEEPLSPLDAIVSPQPRPGADLILTIDREAQFATEQTLAQALADSGARSGTIIVMNPRTGAILALATLPGYDPNEAPATSDDPRRVNPAISSQYEPGSVFKILTMALALEHGVVTPQTTYVDTGAIEVGGAIIRNWDGGSWGVQDMTGLLAHSLNVGAATLTTWLGPERFYSGLQAFYVGQRLGVDMAGEAGGRLKLPGDEDWHESDLGTNAYGQGVAVTPLQMISAVSAVANDGVLMQPHVVAAVVRGGVRQERQPVPLGRPISPATARTLTEMLTTAIAREVGNADVPGYSVAGKTGTASIVREGGFYDPEATIASFIGYLPADDPRLLILVKIDEPASAPWGSVVAAPVFAELAQKLVVLLEIPPDDVRVRLGN